MNTTSNPGNVLFTGGRAPYTLALARSFHKCGYMAFIAESLKDNIAGASKYVEKNFHVPSPAQDTDNYIKALVKIIRENKIDLLIPTCEEVFFISRAKAELEQYCDVFTSPIETLKLLHSKYEFIEHLKKLAEPYPVSVVADNRETLAQEVKKMGQFVIKPEFSRFGTMTIINEPRKAADVEISPAYRWVVQRFISGIPYCSYSVARDGKLLAHSIYPTTYSAGNAAVYFEAVNIPEIERTVAKIVKSLNYTGQISFDFIHSTDDGLYYPIECNPRTTSGVYLFNPETGLPFAFDKNRQPERMLRAENAEPKMLILAMILYCIPKLRSFRELKDFMVKIKSAKDLIITKDDPKPFFMQFKSLFYYFRQAKKYNITVLEASTKDIEWNGVFK